MTRLRARFDAVLVRRRREWGVAVPDDLSIEQFVIEPESARRLRYEILDHRQVVPIDAIEDIVAVDADVVDASPMHEPQSDAKIHDRVAARRGVALAEPS